MPVRQPRGCAGSSRGIGLLEILIALVLVSIGFLAAARMQIEGMRFSQSAYYQSQAYFLASEIVDRMRANVEGVNDGAYSGKAIARNAVDPGCASRNCMPADIARQDIYDWSSAVFGLQGGSGAVGALPGEPGNEPIGTITALGDDRYEIEMSWPEMSEGGNGAAQRETLNVEFTSERL